MTEIARRAAEKSKRMSYNKDVGEAGCYLFLEGAELVEAIRGKGGNPVKEAADVMFVLLSLLSVGGVDVAAVASRLEALLEETESRPMPLKGGPA